MQPLAQLLRQAALDSSVQQSSARVQGVARLLHMLVTVRGYKTVVRFFPHEAADLERVLQVCAACLHGGGVCVCVLVCKGCGLGHARSVSLTHR